MVDRDTTAIVEWLADGARSAADTQDVLRELCDRLLACEVPIWRVGLFILTLHPQIMGRACIWTRDGSMFVNDAPYERFETESFRNSPIRRVIDTGMALRRRLADENCPIEFVTTRELKEEGATDYLALPVMFADGAVHGASFATQALAGFAESHIAALQSIAAPLARVIENRTLRRTASTLLDTYVGNQGGSRILAGHIRRGDADTIDAAIWLSDMRGFTTLADRVPPHTLLEMLNRYFDCQVPAILDHGGEVLKFMGDGLLAIFSTQPDGGNRREICNAALEAARQARAAVSSMFGGAGDEGVRFGLALHLGQVLYGNIGSGNRLDFTCIGPAVNLAARVEKLTGRLGRTILASKEFAQYCRADFDPIGDFELSGFATPMAVFGLRDEIGTAGG